MKKRLIQAAILLPTYIIIVFTDAFLPLFHIGLLVVSLVIVWEILHMAGLDQNGDKRTIATTMIFMIGAYFLTVCGKPLLTEFNIKPLYKIGDYPQSSMQFSMWLSIILISLLFLVNMVDKNPAYENHGMAIFTALFAFTYVGICFWHFALFRIRPTGKYDILIIHICAWMSDTGGYIVGRRFGKHKLKHTPSPNKSVEGFIGMFLFVIPTVFVANLLAQKGWLTLILGKNIPYYPLWVMLVITVLFTLTGFLGDMGESLIKRAYKQKDSGTMFKGHGGVFDIFDSVILTMPIAYYVFMFLNEYMAGIR